MKRVLFVSVEGIGRHMAGPGVRLWEIAQAVARHGCAVTLAVPAPAQRTSEVIEFAVHAFEEPACRRLAESADVVVAQAGVLARLPGLAEVSRPMAFDLSAPLATETLAAAPGGAAGDRAPLHAADLATQRRELQRGDFFVCASERQRDYLVGMLALEGRVTAAAHAADPTLRRLVDTVPPGVPARPPRHSRAVLKGVRPGIGRDDVVVLWGGGLWTWLDPLTPIRGIARAVRARPDLKLFFMASGRPDPAVDLPEREDLSGRAAALAGELGLRDRHVFFNESWVPYDEREDYLLEADIGICAHPDNVETVLAVRARIADYVWAELPMLVTGGDTLSEDLVAAHGLGTVVPPADDAAWAGALLAMAAEPDRRARRRAAFARLGAELAWDRVVEPLARFCMEAGRQDGR